MMIQGKRPGSPEPINVTIERGVFAAIEPHQGSIKVDVGGPDHFLCPGFFDPQVNGFGGVDFNGLGKRRSAGVCSVPKDWGRYQVSSATNAGATFSF